jgi:hypothetical protein
MIVTAFAVKVPVRNEFNAVDKATTTVERYLYPPFRVLGTEYVEGEDFLRVVVAGAFRSGSTYDEARTNAQRDRFASGLYGTTEPITQEV